jgi:FdhE protein
LENLKKRIQWLKKKKPGYTQMLDFYKKVREAQDEMKSTLRITPIQPKKEWKELLAKEGFPLLDKKEFPLDIKASLTLFQTLCQIAKEANPYMAQQVEKIEEATLAKKLDMKQWLKGRANEQKLRQKVSELGLDETVFLFLIQNSLRPTLESRMEQLQTEINMESWLKGYCPICGSLPQLSLLKEEAGKRYLLCSYCGYQWRIDRLICPFCNNNEQEFLHYFYSEEEEAYRIDLCDKCHHYIKTIDLRKIEESDPVLEDLATLHLDLLASNKGYKKPVPNPWLT